METDCIITLTIKPKLQPLGNRTFTKSNDIYRNSRSLLFLFSIFFFFCCAVVVVVLIFSAWSWLALIYWKSILHLPLLNGKTEKKAVCTTNAIHFDSEAMKKKKKPNPTNGLELFLLVVCAFFSFPFGNQNKDHLIAFASFVALRLPFLLFHVTEFESKRLHEKLIGLGNFSFNLFATGRTRESYQFLKSRTFFSVHYCYYCDVWNVWVQRNLYRQRMGKNYFAMTAGQMEILPRALHLITQEMNKNTVPS